MEDSQLPSEQFVHRAAHASGDSSNVWKAYGVQFFWVSVAFFGTYPICNWLNSQRSQAFALYLQSELNIPFIPEFAWIYLSMYALFLLPPFVLDASRVRMLGRQLVWATAVSGAVFLLAPTKLGFSRVAPPDPPLGDLFTRLFAVDAPHNLVPSLHVAFSSLIVLACSCGSATATARLLLRVWLALLCVSTILVHQHHILDVLAGLAVALIARKRIRQ